VALHRSTPAPSPVDDSLRRPAAAETIDDRPTPHWPTRYVLVAIGALPLLLAIIRLAPLVPSGWTPIRDDALIELRTADVGVHTVLVGPYSRFGWHHPGPSLFYVFALPYRLLSRSSVALPLTAVVINLVAVVTMAAIAWRRGGRTLLIAFLLVLQVQLATLGPWVLRSAWNPNVTILPLALVLMLAWCSGCGERWCLPLAAAVGSFVVQSHVGFAAVVGVVLVASATWVLPRRGTRVPIALAAGVVALLWLPPAAEQLTGDPGNLDLIRSSVASAEPSLGPVEGVRVALVRLGAIPAWLTGTGSMPGPDGRGGAAWPGALTLAVLAAAAGAAWHQGRRDRVRLATVAAVAFVGCAWTTMQTEGDVEEWLVAWMSLPGLLVWALATGMALDRVFGASPPRRAVPLVAGLALTAMAAANGMAALDVALWRPEASDTVASLERQLTPRLRAEERPPLMTFGPRASHVSPMGWGAGLVLALEKRGVDVRVDPRWRLQFGERRTDRRGTGVQLVLTTDRSYAPPRHWDLVADADGVAVYASQ
jgi:hypothetical protein